MSVNSVGYRRARQGAEQGLLSANVDLIALCAIYFVAIFTQGGGYALYILYAFALTLSGRLNVVKNKGVVRNFLAIFLYFVIAGGLATHFDALLYFQECFKVLGWIVIAILFGRASFSVQNSFFVFARYVTLFGGLLLPLQMDRLQGFYSHPNHLAYVSSLLIAWTLIFERTSSFKKWLFALALFALVLLSKSSGGLINALLALGFGLAFSGRINTKSLVVAGVVILLGLSVAVALGIVDELLEKVLVVGDLDLEERASAQAFGADGSFVWRVTYWIAIYGDFSVEKGLSQWFGIGPGLMGAGNYFYDYMIVDPHNDYLRVLVERGWVGLIVFYAYFFAPALWNGRAFAVVFLVALQMSIGNVIVHLPTVVIFIAILSLINRNRSSSVR